jgi:hypothetical protein
MLDATWRRERSKFFELVGIEECVSQYTRDIYLIYLFLDRRENIKNSLYMYKR